MRSVHINRSPVSRPRWFTINNCCGAGGIGYADLSRKTPATPSTIYSICSISKLFTCIGVMQLRDEGKLRLDDPVARHIPWFKIKRSDPLA